MKRIIALLLAVGMMVSLPACGKKATPDFDNLDAETEETSVVITPNFDNMVVEGKEISVKDFLIAHLNDYIHSEAYLARQATYAEEYGDPAEFSVTRVIEIVADNLGPKSQTVHFLAVKADCRYAIVEENSIYEGLVLAVNYENGTVYDRFTVDSSWADSEDAWEFAALAIVGGRLSDPNYTNEALLANETRNELSEAEIAEINAALVK